MLLCYYWQPLLQLAPTAREIRRMLTKTERCRYPSSLNILPSRVPGRAERPARWLTCNPVDNGVGGAGRSKRPNNGRLFRISQGRRGYP